MRIQKEYVNGEEYAAAFYGQLNRFADDLERRYSPFSDGSRGWTEFVHDRQFLRDIGQNDYLSAPFQRLPTEGSRRAQVESLVGAWLTGHIPPPQERLSPSLDDNDLTDLIQ